MKYKVINLGTKKDPKNVNLGLSCSSSKRATFINLFRPYKDIFTWTYNDLKMYDKNITQHVIPLEKDSKPYQQKI